MATEHTRRRERARQCLIKDGLDGFLITAEKNVKYLTGFTGDSTWLILTPDSELLISDFRYVTQLAEECSEVRNFIRKSKSKMTDATVEKLQDMALKRIAYEGHSLTCEIFQLLKDAAKSIEFHSLTWEIEKLRAVKDELELAETREAVRLAEKGFGNLLEMLTPQATEQRLAYELEHAVRGFGGDELAFPPIIAVGDRSALPHYRPGRLKIADSPILLVDWGAQTHSGYKSDLTRTVLTAHFSDAKFEKIYKTVLEAQLLAIEKIGPGVSTFAVDQVARDHIHAAGFGEYFDHGLGHGIGLDIHELPRFSQSSDTQLQPGMVVTVEPGIYLQGWGGVRIEDDVLVTHQGCELLSSLPKDWESVRVHI